LTLLFNEFGKTVLKKQLHHQRVDPFQLLWAQRPHASSYWTAWPLKFSFRAMRRLPVFSTMPEGSWVLHPAL
jgi:hypothetical protein